MAFPEPVHAGVCVDNCLESEVSIRYLSVKRVGQHLASVIESVLRFLYSEHCLISLSGVASLPSGKPARPLFYGFPYA